MQRNFVVFLRSAGIFGFLGAIIGSRGRLVASKSEFFQLEKVSPGSTSHRRHLKTDDALKIFSSVLQHIDC